MFVGMSMCIPPWGVLGTYGLAVQLVGLSIEMLVIFRLIK